MKEELFKEVFGAMIDTKYTGLSEKEVAKVVLCAFIQFCERFGVKVSELKD